MEREGKNDSNRESDHSSPIEASRMIGRMVQTLSESLGTNSDPKTVQQFFAKWEEKDPIFHEYELVRWMRDLIKLKLQQTNFYNRISTNSEEEVVNLMEETGLLKELEQECMKELKMIQEGTKFGLSSSSQVISMDSDDDDDTSTWKSWDSVSLNSDLMGEDELEKIAEVICAKRTLRSSELRLNALESLLQFSSEEIVYNECWSKIRSGIRLCLDDQKERVVILALHLMVRLSSAVMSAKGDLLINLCEHLTSQFRGISWDIDGLDINLPKVQLILKKFRLLNYLLHQVVIEWFDFPGDVHEQITSSVFNLLQISKDRGKVTPLHFTAVFDPQAKWFRKWMFCPRNRNFTSKLGRIVRNHFAKYKIETSFRGKLNESYESFMLSFAGRLINSSDGRSLFPIKYPDKNRRDVNLKLIFDWIIRSLSSSLEELSAEILLDVVETSSTNIQLFESDLLSRILYAVEKSKSNRVHNMIERFLVIISSFPSGRSQLPSIAFKMFPNIEHPPSQSGQR